MIPTFNFKIHHGTPLTDNVEHLNRERQRPDVGGEIKASFFREPVIYRRLVRGWETVTEAAGWSVVLMPVS